MRGSAKEIKKLKEQGYKVKVRHFRRDNLFGDIDPRGGRTEVTIEWSNGFYVKGVAACSDDDNYDRRIGRDIAFGRAFKEVKALQSMVR